MSANGNLALRHDLEQRRLHLCRRAVDFVGEHDVGEDRAPLDVEFFGRRPPDASADDVGRYQVGRELQASEIATDHPGKSGDGKGFREAGYAFDQAMAAGEQRDEYALDQLLLTDDHVLDLEERVLEEPGGSVRPVVG